MLPIVTSRNVVKRFEQPINFFEVIVELYRLRYI